MTVKYIWHDCFLLETEQCRLIFDYWHDPEDKPDLVLRHCIDNHKPTVVFVSHHHKDHFNKQIFSWKDKIDDIKYILSKDTAKFVRHYIRPESNYNGPLRTDPSLVTILTPGDSTEFFGAEIHAFDSTDIGNSYLVEIEGKKILHAGDLNAWTLREQSTQAQIAAAIRDFNRCLDGIQSHTDKLDIAFFPLDPRTGSGWLDGAEILLQRFDVEQLIPMHYCLAEDHEQQKEYYSKVEHAMSYLRDKYKIHPIKQC